MAPLTVVKLPAKVADEDQVQAAAVTPPSGSLRVAVRDFPTVGVVRDRVTTPGSSTLVTLIVRATVSVPP